MCLACLLRHVEHVCRISAIFRFIVFVMAASDAVFRRISMKVAVIGNGNVGLAVFRELQSVNGITELALVGRSAEKIASEIEDYEDAASIRDGRTPKMTGGGYDKAAGADILVFTAGTAQLPGEQTRMQMLGRNIRIAKEVFGEIKKYVDNPIIIIITNPADIITAVVQKEMGIARTRVFSTGTLLDTGRLRKTICRLLEISPKSVDVMVIGEHGDSCVPVLSAMRILGMNLQEFFASELGVSSDTAVVNADKIQQHIKNAGYKIWAGKGSTAYGVSAAAAKLVSTIISDSHEIIPVSLVLDGEYGVKDIAISVPCVIGANGVECIKQMQMADDEAAAFRKSVDFLKEALQQADSLE